MTDAGFFRGTSAEQDNRFSDKHKKLLKQMKFADCLSLKIDTSKVNLDVLRPWVTKRVTEILGMEDELVSDFIMNQLEAEKSPDPKTMQINLTGFLNGRNAREFMGELWSLLNSATNSPNGIPQEFIEAKKQEIMAREEAKKNESNEAAIDRLMPQVNGSNNSNTQSKTDNSRHTNKDGTPPSPRRGRNDGDSPSIRKISVSPGRRRSRSPRRSRSAERKRSRSPRHHSHRHHSHRQHRSKHSSHRRRHSREESRSSKSRSRRDRDRDSDDKPRDKRDKVRKSKRSRHSSSSDSSSDPRSDSPASSTSSHHHHHHRHHHSRSSSSRHKRRRSRSREGRSHRTSSARPSHVSSKVETVKEVKKDSDTSKKRSPSPEEEERLRETALKSLRNK